MDYAKAASQELYGVLSKFKDYKKNNLQGVKSTLLVHSMGNIVFANMMAIHNPGILGDRLFNTIVLNSADADADGHHEWVEKVDFTPKVIETGEIRNLYITINEHDAILGLSAKRQGRKRLGQKMETMFHREFKLAKNANYVDVTEIGVNHRYFLKSGQNKNPFLQKFYDSVLNGESLVLKDEQGKLWIGVNGTRQGNGNIVYELKPT